jgi:hypothetical protein
MAGQQLLSLDHGLAPSRTSARRTSAWFTLLMTESGGIGCR